MPTESATLLEAFLTHAEEQICALDAQTAWQPGDEVRLDFTVRLEVVLQPVQYLGGGPELRRARLKQHLQTQVAQAFGLLGKKGRR